MFKLSKSSYLVITIILIISTITGILLYLPVNDNKIKETVINGFNTNPIFSTDKTYPLINGYNGLTKDRFNDLIITKKDPFNSVVSFIRAGYSFDFNPKIDHDVYLIYLKRDGLNSWKIEDYKYNNIKLEFEQVKELVQKYDITTDFPGKSNYKITNYPPLTPKEIASNRKLRERDQSEQDSWGYLAQEFNQIRDLTSDTEKLTRIKKIQAELENALTSLKNNQPYTNSKGITVQPTEINIKTTEDLLKSINLGIKPLEIQSSQTSSSAKEPST